jgi:hypothetical protein
VPKRLLLKLSNRLKIAGYTPSPWSVDAIGREYYMPLLLHAPSAKRTPGKKQFLNIGKVTVSQVTGEVQCHVCSDANQDDLIFLLNTTTFDGEFIKFMMVTWHVPSSFETVDEEVPRKPVKTKKISLLRANAPWNIF